jgi:hypothetical protein
MTFLSMQWQEGLSVFAGEKTAQIVEAVKRS